MVDMRYDRAAFYSVPVLWVTYVLQVCVHVSVCVCVCFLRCMVGCFREIVVCDIWMAKPHRHRRLALSPQGRKGPRRERQDSREDREVAGEVDGGEKDAQRQTGGDRTEYA